MPTIFTGESDQIEPAREAHVLLFGKLFFAVLLPSLVYLLLWILSIEVTLPVDKTNENIGLLLLLGITNLIQFLLVAAIFLEWKNHAYFFTEGSITERKGLFATSEETFDLKNVRNVTLRQGVFGQLFHFGDLSIHSTAPQFTEDITLIGISHPEVYQSFLKKYV